MSKTRTTIAVIISLFCCGGLLLAGVIGQRQWGLEGRYYQNNSMAGTPTTIRKNALPHLSGDEGETLSGVPVYSVVWEGWIAIPRSGVYQFSTNSDDGSKLLIDGQLVVDNGGKHRKRKISGEILLEKGVHALEIRYVQYGGLSVMQTFWTPPGKQEKRLPSYVLFRKRPTQSKMSRRNWLHFVYQFARYTGGILLCLLIGTHVFRKIPSTQRLIIATLTIYSLIIFGLTYFSSIKHTGSDPLGSLLTSQALLTHGTIRLDAYSDQLRGYSWQVYEQNGHHYYYYPPGTPVFSLPAVLIANWLGYDMTNREHDAQTQWWLSSILSVCAFLLIYRLCRHFCSQRESLWLALSLFLSSSLVNVMGSALWNMNFTVIFHLLSLNILAADVQKRLPSRAFYWLGFFLFAAYLCRPTAAIFIVVVFGYILLVRRSHFLRMALFCVALLAIFIAWSWNEYHQILPRYYLPEHQLNLGRPDMWLGLYGTLFSPGRGVFVYNPVFILTLLGAGLFIKTLCKQWLFWLSLGWFTLHTLAVSRFPVWHGGGSYGSRLFADVLPALILLTILIWHTVEIRQYSLSWRAFINGIYLLFALWGGFVNIYQGLYNWATIDWNVDPHIESHPETALDWRYPQFLATPQRLAARSYDYQKKRLHDYDLGEVLTADRNRAIFVNWLPPEQRSNGTWFRWSNGYIAQIFLDIEPFNSAGATQASLMLVLSALREQTVEIRLNHQPLGTVYLSAGETKETTLSFPLQQLQPLSSKNDTIKIEFPPGQIHSALSPNGLVCLEFFISNPTLRKSMPRGNWNLEIGIRFESLEITLNPPDESP
ncbi:membrane protein, putative [Candidatus Moduliflexus flocculans]|uniref:Membrane protein, putative n=1 Tax=Candidatus Moduliflexus flocculans TaxID=1499966 RepID=A0A0S6VQ03_9BACT|nr:membrane protein, putative [Candidatus Moduliflexus flocculans]